MKTATDHANELRHSRWNLEAGIQPPSLEQLHAHLALVSIAIEVWLRTLDSVDNHS